MSGPGSVSSVHDIKEFLGRWGSLLEESLNLNVVALVFKNIEWVFIVEKIKTSPGIDFKKSNNNFMTFNETKQLSYQILLHLIHGKGLSWASLSIGEACDDSTIDQQRDQRPNGAIVDFFCVLTKSMHYLFVVEGVVIGEGVVLHVFGDAVDLEFRFMHSHLRVGCWNRIYLPVGFLLLKDWSFPDANSKLHEVRSTLLSAEETCGDRIFSLNLFFSIMISKSISTFLPLAWL